MGGLCAGTSLPFRSGQLAGGFIDVGDVRDALVSAFQGE
jgi:hypothetical protein